MLQIIVFTFTLLLLIWLLYQVLRNQRIFKIRKNWIVSNDRRWFIHTYDEMFKPSHSNWFGLKYPKDSDFK